MTAVRDPETSTRLSFQGPGEPDHVAADSPRTIRSGQLLRLLTRQLIGYHAGSAVPAPDAVVALPALENGGQSEDRCIYRLRIADGVLWDGQGARQVTAGDFVRGLKRVALPTAAHARQYFTDTIEGMREYCEAYDARFARQRPNAPDLAQFQFSHQIAGVRAVDSQVIEIRLLEPANDFLHILATGVAAAAPREYDYYLPDDPELYRNCPSAGPYRIARGRSGDRVLVLEPNPRWNPDTDPIRRRIPDQIRVTPGSPGDHPAWPYATVAWDGTDGNPEPLGYGLGPYLAVNLREQARGHPLGIRAVRRAIAAAIDRSAVRDAVATIPGVRAVVQPGLLPPGSPGYASARPTAGERGDPDRARRELAGAGYSEGIALTMRVGESELERQAAAAVRKGLARAGVVLRPPSRSAEGHWDLALASHLPDWYGNNGRTAVAPLVRSGSGRSYGYRNPDVDRLIASALREPGPDRAAELWRSVEALVMDDLPLIPLLAHACGPCLAAAGAPPRVCWYGERTS